MNLAYIKGKGFINVFIDGGTYTINESHPNYNAVIAGIKENDIEKVRDNLTVKFSLESRNSDIFIDLRTDTLYFKGEMLANTLTKRIIEMFKEGFDITPMERFLANLKRNPSCRAVNELYDFLETGKMPITEDGCFLAYKKVRSNYTDIYSGTFDNSVGAVAEMERNHVDDERSRTCSNGLHFCSLSYLPYFGGGRNNRVMIVKIDPADVVSIPDDYNYTKGRTCRYEVIDEHKGNTHEEWVNTPVYWTYTQEEETVKTVEDIQGDDPETVFQDETKNTDSGETDDNEQNHKGSFLGKWKLGFFKKNK